MNENTGLSGSNRKRELTELQLHLERARMKSEQLYKSADEGRQRNQQNVHVPKFDNRQNVNSYLELFEATIL